MKAVKQLERLKRLNSLIKAECTGTPDELSNRLGISRRQLYCDIDTIKDLGVAISYSKIRRTFFNSNIHELEIKCSLKIIQKEVIKEVNGGFFKKICSVLLLCTEQI